MESFTVEDAVIRARRRWLWLLGNSVAVLMLAFVAAFAARLMPNELIAFEAVVLGLGGTATCALLLLDRWRNVQRGHLSVDASAVRLNGRPVIARSKLRAGRVHQKSGTAIAILAPRIGGHLTCDVELASIDDARRFLAALELPSLPFPAFSGFPSTKRWLLVGAPIVAVIALAVVMRWNLIVAGMLGGLAPVLLFRETVLVGNDGLLLRRSFERGRFIGYHEIVRVDLVPGSSTLTIHRRSGPPLQLAAPLHLSFRRYPEASMLAADLKSEIDRAMAAHAAHESRSTLEALVGRNGRDVGEWLHVLASTSEEQASYRKPALSAERLWELVEDPTAAPSARAGAALALRKTIDDEGRRRLRIASEACAAPAVRLALAAAADVHDSSSLPRALASLEDERAPSPRTLRG